MIDSVDARTLESVRGADGVRLAAPDLDSLLARGVPTDGDGEPMAPTPLTIERQVESGRALFVALDASDADEMMEGSWQDRWQGLFTRPDTQFDWQGMEQRIPALLEEFSGYSSPDLHFAWLAMAGFFVVTVPLNYLVFRKLRRLEWAWVVMVVLSVGFVLIARSTGLSCRGLAARRSAVTLLRVREHARLARATTFVGLFSLTPGDVEIGMGESSAAVVGVEEADAGSLLQTDPIPWQVAQSTNMNLRVPNVRPASFTWCRFDHLVNLSEPFAVERVPASRNESRILHGSGPWAPSQFAVVEGANCFHDKPMPSGGSVLLGPLPVMRASVYHRLCQGLTGVSVPESERHAQHRFLSHTHLFRASPRLAFGSIVGCSAKPTAAFSDGRAADPALCWIFVDRASSAVQTGRDLSVRLGLRTESSSRTWPHMRVGARDLAEAGQVRITLWPSGGSLWRGQVRVPVGLRREWWHGLKLKLKSLGQVRGSLRVHATVLDKGKSRHKSIGLLTGQDRGRDLTIEIPKEQLPVAPSSDLLLELVFHRPRRSPPGSRVAWLEISVFLDVRLPPSRSDGTSQGSAPGTGDKGN